MHVIHPMTVWPESIVAFTWRAVDSFRFTFSAGFWNVTGRSRRPFQHRRLFEAARTFTRRAWWTESNTWDVQRIADGRLIHSVIKHNHQFIRLAAVSQRKCWRWQAFHRTDWWHNIVLTAQWWEGKIFVANWPLPTNSLEFFPTLIWVNGSTTHNYIKRYSLVITWSTHCARFPINLRFEVHEDGKNLNSKSTFTQLTSHEHRWAMMLLSLRRLFLWSRFTTSPMISVFNAVATSRFSDRDYYKSCNCRRLIVLINCELNLSSFKARTPWCAISLIYQKRLRISSRNCNCNFLAFEDLSREMTTIMKIIHALRLCDVGQVINIHSRKVIQFFRCLAWVCCLSRLL